MFISYFVFGLPISYLFGFKFGQGVMGLYFGRVAGKIIQLFLYGYICVWTNWEEQVQKAKKQQPEKKAKLT